MCSQRLLRLDCNLAAPVHDNNDLTTKSIKPAWRKNMSSIFALQHSRCQHWLICRLNYFWPSDDFWAKYAASQKNLCSLLQLATWALPCSGRAALALNEWVQILCMKSARQVWTDFWAEVPISEPPSLIQAPAYLCQSCNCIESDTVAP